MNKARNWWKRYAGTLGILAWLASAGVAIAAVTLPYTFNTLPGGNVPASYLDSNYSTLATANTTVNGVACQLGSSCTVADQTPYASSVLATSTSANTTYYFMGISPSESSPYNIYYNVALGFNASTGVLSATAANATNATDAANMSGGAAGEIPYQTSANNSGFTAAGSAGQYLVSAGTGSPVWKSSIPYVAAGGTSDAITATYSPAFTALTDGTTVAVGFGSANVTTTPTFSPNGLTAHTIVKYNQIALVAGDAPGAGSIGLLEYNSANTDWVLLNPATTGVATTANGLVSATTTVNFSAASAPSAGQLPFASSSTAAGWSNPNGILHTTLYFTAQNVPVTMTAASPVVVTVPNTQYLPQVGSPVQFTGGSVPTGVSLNFQYFVTAATPGGTTYTFSTTQGGTNVNGSGSGSSGTSQASVYVKNSSASYIITEVWGAGGGGGGVAAVSGYVGGGGGAGGYARQKILAANINATETITIGTGGTSGSTSGGTGGTGGTTSFGAHSSATGGGGGTGDSSSASSPGGVAGSGSGGDINLTGQPGFASEFNATASSYDVSGPGGATTLGGAGIGKAVANAAGANGANNSGSGGGGAASGGTAEAGGLGGSGMVIVYEYY